MIHHEPLEYAGWQHTVGDLSPEELPGLAADALARGLDSPSLRALAIQNPDDVRDSRDLLLRTLEELDIVPLEVDDALWRLVRVTAAAIVDESLSPMEGADWIRSRGDVEDEGDLRVFSAAFWNATENPRYRAAMEVEVVRAAAELLRHPVPRRWIRLHATTAGSPITRHHGATGETLDVTAGDLPLSEGLRADLALWNDDFIDAVMGWPRAGGFDSRGHVETFVRRGESLESRIRDELGAGYHVEYLPEPTRAPGVKLSRGYWGRYMDAWGKLLNPYGPA